MSTRGAWGFIVDGKEKVTYNHSDSHPLWLGTNIFEFVKKHSNEEIRKIAERIELISEQDTPTAEQIEECSEVTNLSVSKQSKEDWYCLLRNAQGQPEIYADGLKYMIDSKDFLIDSLFCEWAYIINTDTHTIEIYKGFNKDYSAPGRYACHKEKSNSEYFGVSLINEMTFDEARTLTSDEFVTAINESAGFDEDE